MTPLIELSVLGHKRLVWLPRAGEPIGPVGRKIRDALDVGDTCGVVPDGPARVRWGLRGLYDPEDRYTLGVAE